MNAVQKELERLHERICERDEFLPRDATQSAVLLWQSRLSIRPSMTLRYRDHIGWKSSKIISRLVNLHTRTSRIYSKANTLEFWLEYGSSEDLPYGSLPRQHQNWGPSWPSCYPCMENRWATQVGPIWLCSWCPLRAYEVGPRSIAHYGPT